MSEKKQFKRLGHIAMLKIYQEFLRWEGIGQFFDDLPDTVQMEVRRMITGKVTETLLEHHNDRV